MPVTRSEELVARLCRRSFLSVWSESNPIARPGKELCDVLVACSPDVILFSVKEIGLKDTGDPTIDWARWRTRAIDGSVKQLYGAERFLSSATRVTRADKSLGVALPPVATRRVHRVAVALGGHGKVPYQQGDFGKGFVHVLDDVSLDVVLGELDTVTDFVEYLAAKEALVRRGAIPFLEGQEEDLLAFYVHQGRQFPSEPDLIVIGDELWNGLTQKPEWRARKEADKESYVWDGLIETVRELAEPHSSSPIEDLDTMDEVVRTMARENRFNRRILAQGFNEFMMEAAAEKVRARMMPSPSNVRYVFLASHRDEDRDHRRRELALRCFVARGLMGTDQGDTVVGIATERYKRDGGFSLDVVRLTKPAWTPDDQRALEGIQRDLGYFANPRQTRATGDEFPSVTVPAVGRNEPCPCGSGKKYKKCHGASRTNSLSAP